LKFGSPLRWLEFHGCPFLKLVDFWPRQAASFAPRPSHRPGGRLGDDSIVKRLGHLPVRFTACTVATTRVRAARSGTPHAAPAIPLRRGTPRPPFCAPAAHGKKSAVWVGHASGMHRSDVWTRAARHCRFGGTAPSPHRPALCPTGKSSWISSKGDLKIRKIAGSVTRAPVQGNPVPRRKCWKTLGSPTDWKKW